MAIEHKKIRNDEGYLCQQNDVMKTSNQVVSLGTLEADLGLSRVDLLLVMRELGLEPVKRGMRTWINQDEANSLYKHFGKSNPREPLIAEVVPENDREDRQLAPTGQQALTMKTISKILKTTASQRTHRSARTA